MDQLERYENYPFGGAGRPAWLDEDPQQWPVAQRLAELPLHRQWGFLYLAAQLVDPEDTGSVPPQQFAALVAGSGFAPAGSRAGAADGGPALDEVRRLGPCNPRWDGAMTAMGGALGGDGKVHLVGPGAHSCGGWVWQWSNCGNPRRGGAAQVVQPPAGVIDLAGVPAGRRCARAKQWGPIYTGGGTPVGKLRRRLVAEGGPACWACGLRFGSMVDHDHRTGEVRGLLCNHCNQKSEWCVHLSGCPWAEFMNRGPRWTGLPYPSHDKTRGRDGTIGRLALLAGHGVPTD